MNSKLILTTTQEDSTEEKKEAAEFLEEEKEGVAYIRPRLDMKLSPEKKQICREIVKEINTFGVNQRQVLFIIELLALQLEDNNLMRAIKNLVSEGRQEMDKEKQGLIIPSSTILR